MQAYCLRCKKKVEIQHAKATIMKNRKPATIGTCPHCEGKVCCIGK